MSINLEKGCDNVNELHMSLLMDANNDVTNHQEQKIIRRRQLLDLIIIKIFFFWERLLA